MIRLDSDKMLYDILVPTEFEEIKREDLEKLLEGIVVPQYYAVVALIYKERLYGVVSNAKNNKTSMVKCIPVLAKLHEEDINANGCEVMDRLIIPAANLERLFLSIFRRMFLTLQLLVVIVILMKNFQELLLQELISMMVVVLTSKLKNLPRIVTL